MDIKEWLEEGERLFGKDIKKWKFKCPMCGRVSSVQDFIDLEADPNDAYQVCIGRFNGKGGEWGEDSGYGCNWAAYGLFKTMGNGLVVLNKGKEVDVFDFERG